MIIELVEAMRKWESHCMHCDQCSRYYTSTASSDNNDEGACGVGRALILNLIRILDKGL